MHVPGGGVDESDRNAIGEEIGGEASGREDRRDVFREGFGGGGGDEAWFTGSSVAGDDDSDDGTAAGAACVSDWATRHFWLKRERLCFCVCKSEREKFKSF